MLLSGTKTVCVTVTVKKRKKPPSVRSEQKSVGGIQYLPVTFYKPVSFVVDYSSLRLQIQSVFELSPDLPLSRLQFKCRMLHSKCRDHG